MKQGGVQLILLLHVRDKDIMDWFGKTGPDAYLRYTELCIPAFASTQAQQDQANAHNRLDAFLKKEDL